MTKSAELKKHKESQAAQKEIEFYAAGVAAWYNTMLEHDKSLLALSVAGVGLLITPLTMEGIDSIWRLVLHLLAILSFMTCLSAILWIFKKNSGRIEAILNTDAQSPDPLLTKLDKIAIYAFAAGIIFSATIGVLTTFHTYSINKEKIMANENKQKTSGTIAQDSFNNVNQLNKSFNQANTLKPTSPQSSPTSGTTQPVTPAPTVNKK